MARKKLPKPKNKSKSIKHNRIPELLIISGIFLVCLSLTHRLLRERSLKLEDATLNEYTQTIGVPDDDLIPTHIEIPWNTNSLVTTQAYHNGVWTISPDKVSYLANSARPTQPGNIILYGHNQRQILGNIRALKGGETITLTLQSGAKRRYQVVKIAEVSPTKTSLLLPTPTETLTLYTCSGPLDSLRFVVQAKPVTDPDVVF